MADDDPGATDPGRAGATDPDPAGDPAVPTDLLPAGPPGNEVGNDHLRRVLTAQVYDVAVETALDPAPLLSERLGVSVLLKREDTQQAFSFKVRGAHNKMAKLTADELARGVICASAGNHAQGVALSAARLGCRATIVMPTTTPQVKVDAVAALGATIELHGDSYSDAADRAMELCERDGATFVHPFDDPDVIAGQGTIAMELLRQHQGRLDAVFVPVGGGGLIAGIAAYVKAVRPEVAVIGVQAADSDAMVRSLAAGERVVLDEVGLFSDGTAVKQVGATTFAMVRELVDELVVVDTDATCAAIADVFADTRSIVEPAGALAVAGLKRWVGEHPEAVGGTFAAVLSGANVAFDRLRFVAERSEEREVLFAVTIPERRGSFRSFAELIGRRQLTEFNYRISDTHDAHVFVGLTTRHRDEGPVLAARFEAAGFPTVELTHDELAKEHVRHMVGGRSALAEGERLVRFVFPERPGALMGFLARLPEDWNISLFHHRNQGADYGRVLVGLQGSDVDDAALHEVLDAIGYPWEDDSANPAYDLFLR